MDLTALNLDTVQRLKGLGYKYIVIDDSQLVLYALKERVQKNNQVSTSIREFSIDLLEQDADLRGLLLYYTLTQE